MPPNSLRAGMPADEAALGASSWLINGRPSQRTIGVLPHTTLLVGGRGCGKTRAGAEWVNALVRGWRPETHDRLRYGRIALVGETLADVRDVMIEGASGILSLRLPGNSGVPRFEPGRRRLVWPNGATAMMFSSEDPDSLRGPQFDAAWCDEAGKWKNAEAVFDMLQFGLRLGDKPRQLITTTPKPTKLMRRLLEDGTVTVKRMKSDDNAANLAPGFIEAVRKRYGETALGRQELDGEMMTEREGAMWSRALIEERFVAQVPPLKRIVVAVDPPASARRTSDACGIVAAGRDADGKVIVLADESFGAAKPLDWANRAVGLFRRLNADCLVVEVNQGGDMATAVLASVDRTLPVKPVRASKSKWLRAEPVAAAYQQNRVLHAGRFPALEDEMCDFGPNGLSGNRSPDRLDAMVWAVGELLGGDEPRVRGL